MYPYEGRIAQVNHGMDGNSGSIIVKAVFDNPENLLIPGLYATVVSDTQIQRNALSVPQRLFSRPSVNTTFPSSTQRTGSDS